MTSILIGQDLYASLPAEMQEVVAKAAVAAARYERELSIADVAATQARCEEDGIAVVRMSEEDKAKFKAATAGVYAKYPELADLVAKIKSA